jgi:hypothetical protein
MSPVPDVLLRLCCHGCPAIVVMSRFPAPAILYCHVLVFLLLLSCHCYPFLTVLSSCLILAVLSYCNILVPSSPVPAVLPLLSCSYTSFLLCSDSSFLSVLSRLSCPGSLVLAVIFWSFYPAQAIQSQLSCPGCSIIAVLLKLFCFCCPVPLLSCLVMFSPFCRLFSSSHGCPLLTVLVSCLVQLSCPGCPVPALLSPLSCPCYYVPTVMSICSAVKQNEILTRMMQNDAKIVRNRSCFALRSGVTKQIMVQNGHTLVPTKTGMHFCFGSDALW